MKIESKYQTEILTKDQERVILFHDEPMTQDEIAVFENLTLKQINDFAMNELGFKQFKYE